MTSSFGSRARLPAAALPSIARQIDRIERELHGDRNGRELMVRASFHELLVAIARSGEQHGSGRGGPDRVARVVDHIQQHYSEALELSELAALAGVSSSQLLRLFREELNTTPMACVTDLRLERARELLAAPGPPVTEIALSLGYCDGPHFANAFKRRFGTSPTSYRRGCLAVERATDGGSEMPQRR
jgi:transcriptional regulator GlxA family with amidase domain